jgi:hypothetical protein
MRRAIDRRTPRASTDTFRARRRARIRWRGGARQDRLYATIVRWQTPLVLLAYSVMALALAWPLPRHLGTHIPAGGDALLFLWDLWWFRRAADGGISPFHTDLLYYPHGTSTAFTTLASLESAISVPFQWLGLGPVACYNLLLLASAATGAWAVWALARRATGSSLAAFIAGIVYGWSPYHQARLVGGHLNLASHQWLPLYILALLHTLDALWPGARAEGWRASATGNDEATPRRWRASGWAIIAGLTAAATATTELTYAAFLALWTIFFLAYRGWPLWRARAWRTLRMTIGPLVLTGGLTLLLAAPLLLAMIGEIRRDTSGYMFSSPLETLNYSADTLQYFLPNELHPWASPALRAYVDQISGTPNVAERIVAPGWTTLVLSVLALALAWRTRAVRFWGWTLALGAILGIGPVFHWAGRVFFTPFNASLLFPYALLYAVPGFAIMRAPLRFAVFISLAGALLAAYALTQIRARWPRFAPTILALCAGLIIAESLVNVPLVRVGPTIVDAALAADPVPGAVVDLPLAPRIDYLWYQTQHGRPIVGGYLARQPPDPFIAGEPTLRYLDPQTDERDDAAVRDGAGRRALGADGIRYVVVHWWALQPDEQARLARKLGTVFGTQTAIAVPEEQTSYYQLSESGAKNAGRP